MSVGGVGRSADGQEITIEPGGGFRWNPELGGGGIERIPMSPDGLPPRLVGEISARPGRVREGESPGLGMSGRKFGCGEGERARVGTRRNDIGDFGMRLEGEMQGETGDFGEIGEENSGDSAERGEFQEKRGVWRE